MTYCECPQCDHQPGEFCYVCERYASPGTDAAAELAYHCCGHCAHIIRTYSHLEPCQFGCANEVYSLEVELVAQYQMRRGPNPGDPFDPDLWMHAAAELLAGGML